MNRFSLFLLLLAWQILSCQQISQPLTQDDISIELSHIYDSIKAYQKQGNYQKVFSICKNGINFFDNNNHFPTPVYCKLYLQAGISSINLKDYYNAKFYFYGSFVLDELCEFGIGAYTTILKEIESDENMIFFKDLLHLAKSDTIYLKIFATEPKEFADTLNSTAYDSYNKGEYSSALTFLELEKSLFEAIGQTGNDDYLSIISFEISCASKLGDYDLAKSKADYYLALVEIFKGNNTIVYAEALQTKAGVEECFGNYIEAVELYNESLLLIESIKGKNNIDYIRCLQKIGQTYQCRDDNHIKFLEIELEIEKLLNLTTDATIDYIVDNCTTLSQLYSLAGDYTKSLRYAEKAVCLLETDGQTNNTNYAIALKELTSALIENHLYTKAIELGKKTVRVFSRIDRNIDEEEFYKSAIYTLSRAYFKFGNINKAILTLLPFLSENVPFDRWKLLYFQNIATYYKTLGLKHMINTNCKMCLEQAEKNEGKKSELYADALHYVSSFQEKKGDAVLMLQEAANIYLELYGDNSDGYLNIQKELASIGTMYNEFSSLKDTKHSLLDKYKKLYGKNSKTSLYEYVDMLFINSAQFKEDRDIENLYKTTLELDSLSQNIRALFSENDELYLYARGELARMTIDCYEMTGDTIFYNKGVDIQNEVLRLALSIYGDKNIKYIDQIVNLALIKSSIGSLYYLRNQEELDIIINLYFKDEQSASDAWKYYESTFISKCYASIQELQQRVIDYHTQLGNIRSSKYASACKDLAYCYFQEIHNFPILNVFLLSDEQNNVVKSNLELKLKNAEQLLITALDIHKEAMDFESAVDVLMVLCFLYEESHEDTKLANVLGEMFELWKDEALKQMILMTADEKSQMIFNRYWQSHIDYISSRAYYGKHAELSYDIQLLSKGLLLKSEIDFRNLILNIGDSIIINKFNRLTEIKKILANPNKTNDRDVLNKEHQLLERQLMKDSEQYGNYLHDFSYTFNDVKTNLDKNDIAIEFATIRRPDRDKYNNFKWSLEYFALVLKKDYSSPKIIHLDSEISSDSIYQKVWEPLMDEIKGMKNVYFSPTYELNKLPLESAKLPNGTFISDLGINFYRVSSTREIIKRRKKSKHESAVLYGGIEYNADVNDLIASDIEERSNGLRGIGILKKDVENDLRQANTTWKYLPGTKREVAEIDKLASSVGIVTKLFSSSKGTESTLKNLSGHKIDIVHIATHGFYIKPNDNSSENNPMERSGLVLAGANNILTGSTLPEGVDDGILTADEISILDLRKIDLVVLSACETGLGDITGEGIYGLQRGFKKAGVNSILMSLWKIDDDATQMLMVEFYKNLIKGETKYESLKKAQQYVRSQKGFEDPEYWAGFILLDGLN